MAKFPLPLDTFPPLALTLEDKQALEAAADEVVKCTIEQYHAHLTVHNSVVDPRRWKKIKQREDVCVYHERSTYRIRDTTSSEPVSDFTIMAPMFTFGSIQGSLDDVLYGALNPSLRDMRLKSAYVEDGFVDWGLLAPIITPSEDDPFRELSIKWTVKAHPMLIATVLRMRDALYLESIGTAMTPSGERIGYHLQHSVDVPGVHELTDHQVVRAKVSFCHIFRQRKPNCVEVFVRGVISPMGSASGFITAVSIAEISVSVFRNTHCAEMKTLSRLITAQQQQHHHRTRAVLHSSSSSSSSGASTDSSYSSSIAAGAVCTQCDTSMRNDSRRLFGTVSAPKDKRCRLCTAHVCSRCRVLKTVHLPSPYDPKELVSATVACCTRCLLRIASVPNLSATVAALDARAATGKDVDYIAALLPSISASLSS